MGRLGSHGAHLSSMVVLELGNLGAHQGLDLGVDLFLEVHQLIGADLGGDDLVSVAFFVAVIVKGQALGYLVEINGQHHDILDRLMEGFVRLGKIGCELLVLGNGLSEILRRRSERDRAPRATLQKEKCWLADSLLMR